MDQAEFNYHLLRHALNDYGKNLAQLDATEYAEAQRKVAQSFALEARVLAAPEAVGVMIAETQLAEAVAQVAARYATHDDFVADLRANRLDEDCLRQALHRELRFDAVLRRVAAGVTVRESEISEFYRAHPEKFNAPEQRAVSHILITINPSYPENTPDAARQKIEKIARELAGQEARFAAFAQRYSECPSAMQGGKLGEVTRGQLYPQLDAVLFEMSENTLSAPIQTELGWHLLYCAKIYPSRSASLEDAAPRIREWLLQHAQRAWLNRV